MAADSALKIAQNQTDRFDGSAPASARRVVNNDNNSGAVLTQKEIHPLALEGAKRLISRHTAKTPVVIKSWGTPETVYNDISETLIGFGYEISMAEDIAEKLVEHAVEHAETSRAKYGAKVIALKIEVSKAKPQPQFETGALESQRIDGFTRQAQVAGATTVSMAINTSGTTVTALRDSVAEIMDAMAGASQAVWIDFEAPDKSELQGVANEAALAAMAQIAGGGLAPEQVQELLAEIQALADAGLIAPEIISALQNLQQIQVMAAEGNMGGIKELSQAIVEDLAAALEAGETSPEIIAAVIDALEVIAEAHGLETVIDVKAVNTLKQDVQIAQLTEKLEVIAADLNGADQATLQELIEQLSDVDGADLMAHLDVIQAKLETMGISAAQLTEIKADISTLKDTVIQNLPLEQKLEIAAELGAPELLTLLQELDGAEGLPPELAEIIETLDVENLTVEELTEALAGNGDPAIAELVQQTVLALSNPDVQMQLPQAALDQVNAFLSAQPVLVDAVTAQAVVTTLNAAMAEMDMPAAEAAEIQQVVERLEAGESMDTIDPAIVEAVMEKLEAAPPPEVKADNTVSAVEVAAEAGAPEAPAAAEEAAVAAEAEVSEVKIAEAEVAEVTEAEITAAEVSKNEASEVEVAEVEIAAEADAPTEAKVETADVDAPVEAKVEVAEVDAAQPAETTAAKAEGAQPTEATAAKAEGAQPTEATADKAEGAEVSEVKIAEAEVAEVTEAEITAAEVSKNEASEVEVAEVEIAAEADAPTETKVETADVDAPVEAKVEVAEVDAAQPTEATAEKSEGAQPTEATAEKAEGAQSTEATAEKAEGAQPTEATAEKAEGAQPTEATAEKSEGAKPTEATAEKAEGAQSTEATAEKSEGAQPTEATAEKAEGAQPTEATAEKAEGAKPTEATAAKAEGAQPAEATAAKAEGTQPTETTAAKAEGAQPAEATAAKAEGAQPAEATAAKAEGAQPTETTAAKAEGAQPTETTAAKAEGAQPTEATAAKAEGTQPTEATDAKAEGAQPTEATAAKAEGAQPTEATAAKAEGAQPTEATADKAEGAAPSKLEDAASMIKTSKAENVVVGRGAVKFDDATVLNLQAMAQMESMPKKVGNQIEAVLQTPNDLNVLKAVHNSLGDNTPPAITEAISRVTLIQVGNTPVTTKPDLPVQVAAQSLNLMAQQVKQSGSPAQAELLKTTAQVIQRFENTAPVTSAVNNSPVANTPAKNVPAANSPATPPTFKEVVTAIQKINELTQPNNPAVPNTPAAPNTPANQNDQARPNITPAQKAELLQVREKLIEALPPEQRNDLKPQIEQRFSDNQTSNVDIHTKPTNESETKFESPCSGCGGGKCPGCGINFLEAASQATNSAFGNEFSVPDNNVVEMPQSIPIKDVTEEVTIKDWSKEEVKFESPCQGCSGGKCPGCGINFLEAASQSTTSAFGDEFKVSSADDAPKNADQATVVKLRTSVTLG